MDGLSNALGLVGPALAATDFQIGGAAVSRAEWVAALLGLAMVVCNARVHPLGWPLAALSALLYALVFFDSRLYGQAALQLVFIALAAWGLWQWLRGAGEDGQPLRVRAAPSAVRRRLLLITLVLWAVLGLMLEHGTDSPAPYADALPTAGSLVATWLLARQYQDNWWVWLAVNVCAMGLFAQQGLWPTAGLYLVFAGLSAWGAWMWMRRAP